MSAAARNGVLVLLANGMNKKLPSVQCVCCDVISALTAAVVKLRQL